MTSKNLPVPVKKKDNRGFSENQKAAKAGGTIASNARRELESKSGN